MIKQCSLLLVLVAIQLSGFAKVQLPSVLNSDMVLQQQANVNLWGKSKATSEVQVVTSWDNKKYTGKSDASGAWKFVVKTPKAGGPYQITFSDGEQLVLSNILIGEVWVCSGQSNMEMPLGGFKNQPILNSAAIIAESKNDNIRLFKVTRAFSATPNDDCKGSWKLAEPANAADFSAVAFQYGQMLQKKLGVPVGIIVSSWGGTPIRSWMGQGAKEFTGDEPASNKLDQNTTGGLFNAMIKPLINYTIKGFLWYQGESDRLKPAMYDQKMAAMVKDWRTEWKQKDLPFYFVQIAPWLYGSDKLFNNSAYLREAQLHAVDKIKNSAMAVTLDVGSDKTIHPEDKTTVAARLANCALANTYGQKGISFKGPEYKSMKIKGNVATLKFVNASSLILKNQTSDNFEIAGADKVFHKATVKVTPAGLEVNSSDVAVPVAVRYGFANYLIGDLYNEQNLPASSFRTDDWK